MVQIDRSEIETWGKRQEPKGDFPLLIVKLIFETTPRSTYFQIPSGSAVFLEGWDGFVKCEAKTNFVPDGVSVWEFKTNGAKTQADIDYGKRKANSLGIDKSTAVFIFVTTNIWTQKDDWAEEKRKENVWRDVIVYDANNLSNWLNVTEITFKWFSSHLGRGHNCLTVADYWENWSSGPIKSNGQIKLIPEVITAGRQIECQKIIEFLSGEPNLMRIQGSTKEEAIAFIIAAVMLSTTQFNEQFNAKSLVVEQLEDFRHVKKSVFNLNLIPKFDDTSELHSAVGRKHHVLLPIGPDDSSSSQDIIKLPVIDGIGQVKALIDSGLTEEEAKKLSLNAGRDITILKRFIGFQLNKAQWVITQKVEELMPAIFIGRWSEEFKGDREIIEKLSGESYSTYIEKLNKWLDVESPPLLKIGNSWRLTSPLDAWTNLSSHFSSKEFENFRLSFLEVMQEISPVFELEAGKRYLASMSGKVSNYSPWCREGLTQSLILVGLHGDKLKFKFKISSQHWVDNIIKELLYNAEGNLWISRDHEMPLIAEASPVSFFEAAYHSLSLEDKPIMKMFIEEDSFLTPRSHHTGLLWALEGLAWTEEYVLDAALVLAKLATLDPGGKLANRPMNSLREIFKPWHYQTLASLDDRLKILQRIIEKEPQTGWQLLTGMITKGQGVAFPTHKLRWRLFERSFDKIYQWPEIFATHSGVMKLLVQYFDFTESKLIDLLDKSESKYIQLTDREMVLSFIDANLDKIEIIENSAWNELRSTLSKHRSSFDAPWALPEDQLKKYEDLYTRLEPSDAIERVIWMFNDHWPNFPEGIDREALSYEEKDELIIDRRIEGLTKIYEEFGFEKVKELVMVVKETYIYGDILARIIEKEEETISLFEYLKSGEPNIQNFIQSYTYRKSHINGIDWVFRHYEKLKKLGFKSNDLAKIFYQVEKSKKVWDFLEMESLETQLSYWKNVYPNVYNSSEIDRIYTINKLIEVKRFTSAVDIISRKPEEYSTEKLVEVLEKAGNEELEEGRRFEHYHVTRILEVLEKRSDVNKSILFQLEWTFLQYLSSYGSGHKPKALHDELATNPTFFIMMLSWVYKSDNEDEEIENVSDELKQKRAANAYELLNYWKRIPGMNENGIIDNEFLWNWINEARELAEKSGRLRVADMHIGMVLAQFPEKEEPWPPREICVVIETINSDSLKNNFYTATLNKRGSSFRGVFDGGTVERGHAAYFRRQLEIIKFEFPETAKILRRLIRSYTEDAKQMDESAQRDELDS